MTFIYPVLLASEEGAVTIEFPDFPEAHTYGTDEADALAMAGDCLEVAVASRIIDGEGIPAPPTSRSKGQKATTRASSMARAFPPRPRCRVRPG